MVLIHIKKYDKQINSALKTTNYQSYCCKSAVRSLKDSFNENDLLSSNQSGFQPSDFCINQLLSTNHKIYQSFNNHLEVKGVFLDISKASYKVWHQGPILKLSCNGIPGNLLNVL